MDEMRKEQLISLLKNPLFSINEPSETALRHYNQALTHSSFADEDNERMEFFGDCVLDFFIGEELYNSFDQRSGQLRERFHGMRDEALLTDMLHAITNDRNLARIVSGIPLFDAAILREAEQELTTSIRAGAFEAFISALYDDCGVGKTREIVHRLFAESFEHAQPIISWKNLVQERIQKSGGIAKITEIIKYSTERDLGTPDNDARHRSELWVKINGKDWELWGVGYGRRIKDAEMNAAENACRDHCQENR